MRTKRLKDDEIIVNKEEVDKLKQMVEELFNQRSECYFTELNEKIEAGEKVLTVLQNRVDLAY